jgi:hypothetical protein
VFSEPESMNKSEEFFNKLLLDRAIRVFDGVCYANLMSHDPEGRGINPLGINSHLHTTTPLLGGDKGVGQDAIKL